MFCMILNFTGNTCEMVTTYRKCQLLEGRMCNHFLPSLEKDSHDLCIIYSSQQFSLDVQCKENGIESNHALINDRNSTRERRKKEKKALF